MGYKLQTELTLQDLVTLRVLLSGIVYAEEHEEGDCVNSYEC